jgi:hypothetical protein
MNEILAVLQHPVVVETRKTWGARLRRILHRNEARVDRFLDAFEAHVRVNEELARYRAAAQRGELPK